jgi:aminomethyltransferase
MAVALESPSLYVPGLLPRDPDLERYLVRPGGATVVRLEDGDQLTVIDPQGRQSAEVTVVAPPGTDAAGVLGTTPDAPATVIQELTRNAADDGEAVLAALAARGLDPHEARAVRLFGDWSPAGASVSFTTRRDAVCVVAAPARRMSVDDQNPPSELWLQLRRATPRTRLEHELPPPLAEPILDLRIDKATARSYEVEKGQYIQVIDVEGRQCSDFLAFGRRQLEEGRERGLDATTTRTLMGNAYPSPGLNGKFYDQDMQPLCEVVRDLVGRHDTFALACNAKYYEDMGYPGHVNCTDNFNEQLERYAIERRRGWPALNFFYNTAFDDDHILILDEPWSRPGDYVLLRAMTDLVCASSACPDDIDPSNAWEPTDVHVRIYADEHRISSAVGHRVTPDAPARLTKRTGFHPRTSGLARQMVEYRGYWLPAEFDDHGAVEEYWACRERAVVMDLSPLRKFEVLGPDAEALLQWAVTRNVRRMSVGQVSYTAMCNPTGGMIDDATIFRLGDDNFRFVGGEDYDGVWLRDQARERGLERVWVKDSTDQLHNLAVQGPRSREILTDLVWTPPDRPDLVDLKWFRFSVGRIGDHDGIPVIVSRTGYSGELGYEVWSHPDDAVAVWDAIRTAGEPHGLTPMGLSGLDMVRIEAGLIFAGHEFDDQVDPFEAGIGFTVPLKSKEDDFCGREALLSRKEHPQRTLVGLELDGNETAGHADEVYLGRQRVGVVTSGTRSPLLRKNIALCRLAVQHAAPGTAVEVGKLDGHQKRIAATVVPFPFYDPEKERPRS